MRLHELLEGKNLSRSKRRFFEDIDLEKIQIALKNPYKIYRGVDPNTISNYLYVDPTKYNRVSMNTTNYYTLLMDNLPEWSEYPKRSKSIICTTDKKYAEDFGELYVVLPIGNPKIGICSRGDLWNSFPTLLKNFKIKGDLSDFNYFLKYQAMLSDKSFKSLWDALNNPDLINKLYNEDDYTDDSIFLRKWKERMAVNLNPDNFRKIFSPEANNFQLSDLANFNVTGKREVWISSPCYLIKEIAYKDFLKDIR